MKRTRTRPRAPICSAFAAGCLLLVPFLSAGRAGAAEDAPVSAGRDARAVSLRFAYTIRPTGPTGRITFVAVIPRDLPGRQEIVSLRYSVPPTRIFEREGTRYAEWALRSVRSPITLAVDADAVLQRYDLAVARQDPAPLDPPTPGHLAAEPYLETEDAGLRSIAAEIPDGPDAVETARHVHAAVLARLERSAFNPGEVGAAQALRLGTGDCTEFADVFVTLMRIKGVPARVAEGLVTKGRDTLKHNWAEFHAYGLGWIPVDPSNAEAGTARFDELRPIYLRLSTIRNDPVLRGHYWRYRYSGGPPPAVSATVRLTGGDGILPDAPAFSL